jgi:hypothetical protein
MSDAMRTGAVFWGLLWICAFAGLIAYWVEGKK